MKKTVSPSPCTDPPHMRRWDVINKLFDDTAALNGPGALKIFHLVFKDELAAQKYFYPFLKDVSKCPLKVFIFCRKLLAEREKAQQPPGA